MCKIVACVYWIVVDFETSVQVILNIYKMCSSIEETKEHVHVSAHRERVLDSMWCGVLVWKLTLLVLRDSYCPPLPQPLTLDIYLWRIFQHNLSCVLQSSEQSEPQQWVGLMVLCFKFFFLFWFSFFLPKNQNVLTVILHCGIRKLVLKSMLLFLTVFQIFQVYVVPVHLKIKKSTAASRFQQTVYCKFITLAVLYD